MIVSLDYNNETFKIDTSTIEGKVKLVEITEKQFEEFLIKIGYVMTKTPDKFQNWDYYNLINDTKAILVELKTTTKNQREFPTELINEAKIKAIYNKIEMDKSKGISTDAYIIYSYFCPNGTKDNYRIFKIDWELMRTFKKQLIFNKSHYLIPKKCFEEIDKIDNYFKDLKTEILTSKNQIIK